MKIVITGYYGAANGGDELILAALLRLIRRHVEAAEITVLSFNPEETSRMHSVKALYRGPFALRGPHAFGWLRSAWGDIFRAIRDCDVVLVGGGGLWEDIHNFGSIPMYTQTVMMAALLRKPAIGVGLGVGPILTRLNRLLVRLAARHMNWIFVRDDWSARELAVAGVSPQRVGVGADLVFSIHDDMVPPSRQPNSPRIGVTLGQSEWLDVNLAQIAQGVAQAASQVGAEDIVLFPMGNVPGDHAIVAAVSSHLNVPHTTDMTYRSPEEFLVFLTSFDVIISAKLHGVIAGACVGVPVVPLSYAPKVSSAAKALGLSCQAVDEIQTARLKDQIITALCSSNDECEQILDDLASRSRDAFLEALSKAPMHLSKTSSLRLLLDAMTFGSLASVSIARQARRSILGNHAWAAHRALPTLRVLQGSK